MKEILPETTMQEIVDDMRANGMALSMQSLHYGPRADAAPTEEYLVLLAQGPMVQIVTQVMQKIGTAIQRAAGETVSTERIEYRVDPDREEMRRLKGN